MLERLCPRHHNQLKEQQSWGKKVNLKNKQQITVINRLNKLLQCLYTVTSERRNSARFRTQKVKSQTRLSDWPETAHINLSSIIKCQFILHGHSWTATEIVKKTPQNQTKNKTKKTPLYFLNYLKKAKRSCKGQAPSRQSS